jgi:hypothetical protein
MGVPVDAIVPEVWGKTQLTATFRSNFRPTRGGVEIGIINRTRVPDVGGYTALGLGSIGFNVTAGGVSYLLSAGHVANLLGYANGATGDTVTQQSPLTYYPYTLNTVGIVAINPAWDENAACPVRDSTTMAHYDFCTTADVFVATYVSGVSPEKKIVAGNEGQNGASGSQTINGYYGVKDVLPPDMVPQGIGVHKSGRTTGTTTGALDLATTQVPVQLLWQGTTKWILYQNVTRLTHIGNGPGDSGGAIFAGNGTPYSALGILVAGNGNHDSNDNCTSGTTCSVLFFKWSNIEAKLGLGTLSPVTP